MTRKEFIDGYLLARSWPAEWATETGFANPNYSPHGDDRGWPHVALPCHCSEDDCQGWAMVDDPLGVPIHLEMEKLRGY